MKTIQYIETICMTVVILMTSCVREELHNTSHPDKGAIKIMTNWSDALSENTVPETYILLMDTRDAIEVKGYNVCYPELLTPGKHRLSIYNEAEGFDIIGNKATVMMENGLLKSMPDYLFSATKEIEVVADDTLYIETPMLRRLCPVTLNFNLSGQNAEKIAQIDVTLSGISSSIDLLTGKAGNENQTIRFEVKQQGENGNKFSEGALEMNCRITGVCQEQKQLLSLTITMEDNYINQVTSDLTEFLKDVNTNMKPVVINGEINAPQDGQFSASIEDWNDGGNNEGEANVK